MTPEPQYQPQMVWDKSFSGNVAGLFQIFKQIKL
jgi:hypothetical protein